MSIQPLVKEVTINAPVSKVWSAIYEKEHLAKWFHPTDDYTGEIGKTFHMDVTHEGRNFLHTLTITELVPEKKLALDWHINGDAGQTHVTYELEAMGSQTKVTVTHNGFEKYGEAGAKNREGYSSGWDHVLFSLLQPYVETGSING